MFKRMSNPRKKREEGFSGPEAIVIVLFIGALIAFTIGIFSSNGVIGIAHIDSANHSLSKEDSKAKGVVNETARAIQETVSDMGGEELGKISYSIDNDQVTIKAGDTVIADGDSDSPNAETITVPAGVTLVVEGYLAPGKTHYKVRATHDNGSEYNKDDHTWCVTKYYEVEGEEESISNEQVDYSDSSADEYPATVDE